MSRMPQLTQAELGFVSGALVVNHCYLSRLQSWRITGASMWLCILRLQEGDVVCGLR